MKNNYLKKGLALLLSVVMVFTVTACGKEENKNTTSSSSSSAQAQTITLTDQAGREITLDEPAETIVSCYYITTYATIALGISDRVIGLEKKAESRPIYQMAAPDLLKKTQVGTLKEFNVEATASLKPDLVLMPMKLSDYADTLTDLGITVLVVNPESQKLMEEMLTLIAKACGVEKRANELLDYYDDQLEDIKEDITGTEEKTVYMAGNSSYLTTAPGGMYQSDLIALAGGKNVAEQLEGDYWTEVSYETILAYNPQVIIIPCGSEYTVADVLNDQNLADVEAVKNKAVYQMPQKIEEWDSPIPSGILGAMWLTSVLHEEAYPFEEFQEDAAEYYHDFYNFKIDSSLITK